MRLVGLVWGMLFETLVRGDFEERYEGGSLRECSAGDHKRRGRQRRGSKQSWRVGKRAAGMEASEGLRRRRRRRQHDVLWGAQPLAPKRVVGGGGHGRTEKQYIR
jgi:hypothetical protein